MWIAGVDSRQRAAAIATSAKRREVIGRAGGLVHDRAHNVVVPTVRVVIQNHDCCAVPVFALLKEVNDVDYECLLVDRIGITGMAILIRRSLQETDRRKVPCFHRCIEVVHVVVVIRWTVVSDL